MRKRERREEIIERRLNVQLRRRREDKRQPAKNGDVNSGWHERRPAHATRSSPNDKTDGDAAEQHRRGDDSTAKTQEVAAPRRHGRRKQGGEAVEVMY
ncbi:hypothetical protein PIB30_035722 [Stylosanthes scabra]|uniref:Uncharacterized protein n=1 Tax=Stylosanthes scabra TaxID=79078 RepID=A0ABU6YC14_9FABA|nr:hypothetical protein [Stylosanthes scabra]